MSKSRARLLAELLNTEGRVKKDRSDLAGADSVIDLDNLPTITNAKLENSSITIAGEALSLGGTLSLNTGHITEHTDYKYYTDTRARAAISVDGNLSYNSTTGVVSFTERTDAEVRGLVSASGSLSYNSSTGVFSYTTPTTIASLSNHDTDDLAEGTNLYFTNARARAAVSASTGSAGYTSSTGVFTIPSTSDHITEGSNQFFTNARARGAISASGSLSYNSSTGVISYTQPTNISTFTNDSSYITNATASLNADKITAGVLNHARIPIPANGDWWNNGFVKVQTDGVMEVGKYLDFHTADSGGGTDYDVRITASSGAIDIDGDLTVDDITAGAISATSYSGTLASSVTGTTQSASDNSTKVATTAYVDSAVSGLVDSAPGTLNTLNELAAALGDDANFSTTVTNSIATKLPLAGGTITGRVTFPTGSSTKPILAEGFYARTTGDTSGTHDIWGISGQYYPSASSAADQWGIQWSGTPNEINFIGAGQKKLSIDLDTAGLVKIDNNKVWHEGNDGTGSGLDADYLDGIQGSQLLRSDANDSFTGNSLSFPTLSFSINNNNGAGSYDAYLRGTSSHLVLGMTSGNTFYNNYGNSSGEHRIYGNMYHNDTNIVNIWGSGNDGSGSGLDADLLDGVQGASFLRSDAADTGAPSAATALTLGYIQNNKIIIGNGTTSFTDVYNDSPWYGIGRTNVDGWYSGQDKAQMAFYWGLVLRSGQSRIELGPASNGPIQFGDGATTNWAKINSTGIYQGTSNLVWHAGNDGAGSGLDADLLDGLQGSSYWQKSGSWYGDLGSNGYDRVQGVNYTGGEFVLVEKNAQMSTLIDGDYFAYESGGFFSSSSSAYGDLSGFKAYNTDTIQVQQKDGGNANLRVTGSITRAGNTVWDSGNDGAGSGLDADYLDGIQGSQFLRSDAADSWNSLLTYNGSNNGLEVGGIRGTALGSQTGDFIHLYERVNIGYPSGWGASGAAAPAYGLSTWGGAQINIGNVSNAPFTFNGNNVWHAGNDGSGSGLDADTVDGYDLSHMFRTATYSSGYSSTSDQWYTLFSISESTTPVYVTLKNGAHSTATFVVSTGYSGSNEADLTVLNSTWTQNSSYPGAQRVRVAKQSNGTYDVQIKLHWSATVAGFNLYCKMWGSTPASPLPSFVSSLSADTGSPTVIREARCDLDRMNFSTVPYVGDNIMWHAGNDGSGSGLAADTVDGLHASSFLRSDASDTATGPLTFEAAFLSKGHSSGDNWMPYSDGNFYIRSPNTHFDANVEFNDEARVVTGSIAESNSTKGLMFDGNYQTGQYRHRFRKRDLGSGIPLYIDYSHGTANSYSAVASFGGPGSNYNEFTVYGDQDIQGQLIIDNNIASPSNYYNGLQIEVRATSGTAGIGLHRNGYSHVGIYTNTTNRLDFDFNSGDVILNHNAGTLWGSGNDGSGSGLDADTLDGINSSQFLRSDQSDSMSGELNVTHNGGATGSSAPSYSQANIELQTSGNYVPAISFHRGGYSATTLYEYDGELYTSAWTTRSQTGKLISSGNYGSYALPLSGGTVTGTITLGSGGSIDASSNDRYLNFRVIRNAGTANLDGMYIGYGNSNSGHTRLFGGGATSGGLYIRGSGANDLTYGNNTGVIWHSANDGSGTGLDADLLDGLQKDDYRQYTWRSFTVGGDLDKFYPALFSVGNGNHGSSDLEIAQSNVHQNGSSHGAFYARFGVNVTGWGHVPQMMTLREYTKSGNTYISKIADTDHATGEIGIWLRGSTTYYYRCSDGAIFDSVRCTDNQPFKSYDHSNDAYDITISHATSVEDSRFNNSMHSGNVVMTSTIGNYAWTSANDGSGSGLDADLLDGQHKAYFEMPTSPLTQNGNMNNVSAPAGQYASVQFYNMYTPSGSGNQSNYNVPEDGGSHYHVQQFNGYSNSYNNWKYQIAHSFYNGRMYHRNQYDTTWQGWATVWDSDSDGSGSGLDADLLDGQQGSYYQPASTAITTSNIGSQTANQSHMVSGSAFGTTSSPSSVLEYQQASSLTDTKLAPSGDWYNSIRMGHGNPYSYYSNTIAVKMTGSNVGNLYTQCISNNNAQGWNKHWHDRNDGSGSGLDADLLDGQHGSYYAAASSVPVISGTNTWGNNGINYFRVERGGYSGSINTANLQAYTTGSNSAFMSFHRSGSYAVNMGLDADNVLRIGGWSASANRWVLDMSGNMTAAGNVTAYSDIRLKENIEVIPNALEKVNQIRGVTFTRNDQDDKEARHTGVIAQEVEKVLPEVISEDNLGIKNVAYGNMVGLLIEAVKELKQEVDDLKAQLKEK